VADEREGELGLNGQALMGRLLRGAQSWVALYILDENGSSCLELRQLFLRNQIGNGKPAVYIRDFVRIIILDQEPAVRVHFRVGDAAGFQVGAKQAGRLEL